MQRMAQGCGRGLTELLTRIRSTASSLMAATALPDQREKLQEILRACEVGEAVAAQLLSVGRAGSRRPVLLDVADHIRELEVANWVPSAIIYRQEITTIPCPVLVDPREVEDVLRILVSHAVNAMSACGPSEPGSVWVSLSPVTGLTADGDTGRRWAQLQVADTGMGMASMEAKRACEPSFSTRPRGPDRGPGLPDARAIACRAGGLMTIDSARGWGTRVNIWLPFADRDRETLRLVP